jgi:hypothetical protein
MNALLTVAINRTMECIREIFSRREKKKEKRRREGKEKTKDGTRNIAAAWRAV